MKHSFCDDWEFTHHWTEAFGKGLPVPKQQAVRLPHTCRGKCACGDKSHAGQHSNQHKRAELKCDVDKANQRLHARFTIAQLATGLFNVIADPISLLEKEISSAKKLEYVKACQKVLQMVDGGSLLHTAALPQ